MPMSKDFADRLNPILMKIVEHFKTPFHIYNETGIRQTGETLKQAFSRAEGFQEYFAEKALPNPTIMQKMKDMGFGFDCSSIPELILSRTAGVTGEGIMFTSNNTSAEEFGEALNHGGCILNLDDITLIPKVPKMPELICFRYNPGSRRKGTFIIGNPVEAKYGVSHGQIVEAYRLVKKRGAKRFGLHTMIISNELNYLYMVETAKMLLDLIAMISVELGIEFEFINIGGGLGIPYKPEEKPLDIERMAEEITGLLSQFRKTHGYCPKLFVESGRYMTGPHGVLVATCINQKHTYREYRQLDACMSAHPRPAIYGAYHHITVLGKENGSDNEVVDVVGSLCENNDKFAIQRDLPKIVDGDIVKIDDTGAHSWAMGSTYNSRLRIKELLLKVDGSVALIRRAETIEDYFATLNFKPDVLTLK